MIICGFFFLILIVGERRRQERKEQCSHHPHGYERCARETQSDGPLAVLQSLTFVSMWRTEALMDSNYFMSEAQQPAWNRAKESHLLKGFANSGRQYLYKQPEMPPNVQNPHLSSTWDVLSHVVLCIISVLVRLAWHSACVEVRTTFRIHFWMRIIHRLPSLNTWYPAGSAVQGATEPLGDGTAARRCKSQHGH